MMRANKSIGGKNARTADFAIRVTSARGSSKFSMPSETASCCACADAGVLALSFRGMTGLRIYAVNKARRRGWCHDTGVAGPVALFDSGGIFLPSLQAHSPQSLLQPLCFYFFFKEVRVFYMHFNSSFTGCAYSL